ncbi:hypothetical protein JX265_010765 [Neoarthrinium moseri]|uniref:Uncharacterized protein n=1 Tax=Neoarthrinium moseri TaxID=1658444 RepID=A0A9P9WE03_9PEZI|nr:uncharacterized protein JN550_007280 [Neoarthrinium moseri]KAI1851682.1 hypothetical protein JX266_003144 [Neoarthrinium moseri]KAI1858672.1 hypothetical protein JX265_010765 [Neoarthrinium moseri]KAI1867228.1 hypothetical protein JN550_007280 [Neoarthrinium moseri]
MASNYNGARRAGHVNFSSFIHDLNEITPPQQEVSPTNDKWEDDLSMFTNTNFLDWDQSSASAAPPAAAAPTPVMPAKEVEVKTVAPAAADPSLTSAVGDFDFATG